MTIASWRIECLKDRIASLDAEIDRVSKKPHPYDEPELLYRALRHALDERARGIDDGLRLSLGPAFMDAIDTDVEKIAEAFSVIDRVDSARIPFEILRPLAWAASALIGRKYRAIVRLHPGFDYRVVEASHAFTNLVGEWEREWKEAASQGAGKLAEEEDVLLLTIPSAYAGSVLLNALSAHEFGHVLLRAHDRDLDMFNQKLLPAKLVPLVEAAFNDASAAKNSLLEEEARRRMDRTGRRPTDDRFTTLVQQVRDDAWVTACDWSIELYADLVAVRLLGPAFLAAFERAVMGGNPSASHPPRVLRLDLMGVYLRGELPEVAADPTWEQPGLVDQNWSWREEPFYAFEEAFLRAVMPRIAAEAADVPSPLQSTTNLPQVVERIGDCIAHLTPPSAAFDPTYEDANAFWLTLYAAWRFRRSGGQFRAFAEVCRLESEPDDGSLRRPNEPKPPLERHVIDRAERVLGNLVLQGLRALELRRHVRPAVEASASEAIDAHPDALPTAAVITRRVVAERHVPGTEIGDRLVVEPFLHGIRGAAASLDIHLGNRFTVFLLGHDVFHDPLGQTDHDMLTAEFFVNFGDYFVLHPGQLVLGTTLEWLTFPMDVCADVDGRSILARKGLQIRNADMIQPGSAGTITLEFSNTGLMAFRLRPGIRIGHLVFKSVEWPAPALAKRTSFAGEIRPIVGRYIPSASEDALLRITNPGAGP